jgi:hypothetical protein
MTLGIVAERIEFESGVALEKGDRVQIERETEHAYAIRWPAGMASAHVAGVAKHKIVPAGGTRCNGKCRKGAADPACPLHGKGGKG